ncbi:MAG: IS607 family transposase [Cyanobacteria bacterium P01_D01_bin.50]
MYLTPKQVYERFGFHPKTLALWADEGKVSCIKSPGGHRRYSLESLENISKEISPGETILYARVSTNTQKDDLKTQIEYLGKHYPGSRCISEMGSGLNFKRKKFLKLMESVSKREVSKIVVAHKERLVRFGFDFIEWFCNLHGCEIVIINNNFKTPQQEMLEDFLAIMHCYSSKLYFLRSYEKKIQKEAEKLVYNSE